MQFDKLKSFNPGDEWVTITTLDAHTGGEPLRIITSDLELPGKTILEKRRWIKEHADHIRKCLMWEPRGHREMYGCIVTPPVNPGSDMGVIFLHNEGYSTMCGHGIIAMATVATETGMVPMTEPETLIRIDSPAGLITAHVRIDKKHIQSVYFHNVPSFVVALDDSIKVPGLGPVRFDLAFGGAYYAYVEAASVGLKCDPSQYPDLIERGMAIKTAVMKHRKLKHPYEKDLNFLYGTIFTGPPQHKTSQSRNVCIFADGEVDRSPTGTGVSGRAAIHFARGEIGIDEPIVIESIIGTTFSVKAVETVSFGDFPAIIPEVEGSAHITGRHEFLIDPADPLKHGFFMG
jgi:proline racemase